MTEWLMDLMVSHSDNDAVKEGKKKKNQRTNSVLFAVSLFLRIIAFAFIYFLLFNFLLFTSFVCHGYGNSGCISASIIYCFYSFLQTMLLFFCAVALKLISHSNWKSKLENDGALIKKGFGAKRDRLVFISTTVRVEN